MSTEKILMLNFAKEIKIKKKNKKNGKTLYIAKIIFLYFILSKESVAGLAIFCLQVIFFLLFMYTYKSQ